MSWSGYRHIKRALKRGSSSNEVIAKDDSFLSKGILSFTDIIRIQNAETILHKHLSRNLIDRL